MMCVSKVNLSVAILIREISPSVINSPFSNFSGNFGAETLLLEDVTYSDGSVIIPITSPFTQIQHGVIRVAPVSRDATT